MISTKKLKSKDGSCEVADFEAALKFHEVVLDNRQMELINMVIYQISGEINCIPYLKLIKYFNEKSI
jgi:hypothetical protein